jgi:hypothetical protein
LRPLARWSSRLEEHPDLIVAYDPGEARRAGGRRGGPVDAVGREALGALRDELEDRVAHAELVLVLEGQLRDEAAVDEGAVAAPEVRDDPPRAPEAHARVLAADGALGHTHAARGVATDDEVALGQEIGRGELVEVGRVEQHQAGARGARGLGRGVGPVALHGRGRSRVALGHREPR